MAAAGSTRGCASSCPTPALTPCALTLSGTPKAHSLRRPGAAVGGLDPLLEIGYETQLGFSPLLSDDDGGGDTNARLVLDASGLDGVWLEALRIKARAFQDSAGDYELVVSPGGD